MTSDQILDALLRALVTPLERSGQVAHGDAGFRPWEVITDPATAPLWALPHAALYTGGQMPRRDLGESDDAYLARARHEVVYPRGMRRGSAATVLAAARKHLTGTKAVLFREGFAGDPWLLEVVTRTEETPSMAAVLAEVRTVLPAGIVLEHQVRDTRDWETVRVSYSSWADVLADTADWQEVLEP